MDRSAQKVIVRTVALAVFVVLAFFFGPPVIQAAYRSTTPEEQIREKQDRYRLLDREIFRGLDVAGFAGAGNELNEIQLWLEVRGAGVADADKAAGPSKRWRAIFRYWGVLD